MAEVTVNLTLRPKWWFRLALWASVLALWFGLISDADSAEYWGGRISAEERAAKWLADFAFRVEVC